MSHLLEHSGLESTTKAGLFEFARRIAVKFGVRPPDRTCRRQRRALICWFCEHAHIVLEVLQGPRRNREEIERASEVVSGDVPEVSKDDLFEGLTFTDALWDFEFPEK
jgi:hypothetical protein